MYETPHTYEYMMDPMKREKNQKSRVPKTEKRPPGEDVEFIDGSRGKERSDEEGERSAGRRNAKGRPQKDGGSSDSGGGGGGETEERSDETAETKHRGRVNVGDLARGARYVHDELPVKHKIHKKNEFSKKQQFYDEEHVDRLEPAAGRPGVVRKPDTAAGHEAKRHGQHGEHREPNVKRIVRRKKRKNPPTKNTVPAATTSGYKRPTGGRVGQYGLQNFEMFTN
ncbi:uncharacterized protein LOC126838902 [Adelges cooleyi]|uniref:uncharacterized protein LOC126838902 n=1 Tax=Adelges cooleyi TaxID=133065 RepID=UPI00218018F6|nr:uncharacterized protein LOC126838902 [Adelges cooleyi]